MSFIESPEYLAEDYQEVLPHYICIRTLTADQLRSIDWLIEKVGPGAHTNYSRKYNVPPNAAMWYMDWGVNNGMFEIYLYFRELQDALLYKLTWSGQ